MRSYDKLIKKQSEITKLNSINGILYTDMDKYMSEAGEDYRGELLELLSIQIDKLKKSKNYLKLVEETEKEVENNLLSDDEVINFKEIEKEALYYLRVPSSIIKKLSKINTKCSCEWKKVKTSGKSDKSYLKMLKEYIDLTKQYANFANHGEFETAYDFLLDSFNSGITCKQIDSIFSKLEIFLNEIEGKIEQDDSETTLRSDEKIIMKLCNIIAEMIIKEDTKFKVSTAVHPSCATLGINDVRITTKVNLQNTMDSVSSIIHESGHANYEIGLPKEYYGLALGSAPSMAAHEGISLFYEKHIGESDLILDTIKNYTGLEKNWIKEYLAKVNFKNPIRIKSDEITYQRHILLRYKMEKELFNEGLEVENIGKRWNELAGQELDPKDGYAQDVHWSNGLFGYFPAYTLGHLIAAQLKYTMVKQNIDLQNFTNVKEWLQENYFKHGSRYGTFELIKIATGEELNPNYWFDYIRKKYNCDGCNFTFMIEEGDACEITNSHSIYQTNIVNHPHLKEGA